MFHVLKVFIISKKIRETYVFVYMNSKTNIHIGTPQSKK